VSTGPVVAPWREGETRPTAPRILGPRRTTDRTPTFRFVSHEVGLRSRAIRFRCAIDRRRLHSCSNPYTPTLRLGRHALRVRAVDPRGRTSRTRRHRGRLHSFSTPHPRPPRPGRPALRVRAVAPRGRTSRTSVARVAVVR